MERRRTVICEYQPYFDFPLNQAPGLYQQASSNDKITVETWKKQWIEQYTANHKTFGPFHKNGVGKLFGLHKHGTIIVAGSGPSLKNNAEDLKKRGEIPLVSCLHNYHFFEDKGIEVDYYISLDAGEIAIKEMAIGGQKTPEEYWKSTKNKTLICYCGSHPELAKKWQGKIYWYNVAVPDANVEAELAKVEDFRTCLSTGGNVLGACLYFARGILGATTIGFIGADFSFSSEDNAFHPWNDPHYNGNLGQCVWLTNVYGHRVRTWQSYANFKSWFDYISQIVPTSWFNCSEDGCLGSYPEGNIRTIKQLDLKAFLFMQNLHDEIREQCLNPQTAQKKILF